MNNTVPSAKPGGKRRQWIIITALTLVVVSVLVLLPMGVQVGLRNWLLENGGDRVQVADVDLNLFTGTLQLEGVAIDVDEQNTLNAERVRLSLAWLPLLKKHVVIEALAVNGVTLEIRQNENGQLRAGGILIPSGNNAETLKEDTEQAREEKASDWKIGIDTLVLSDINIRYAAPKLQMDTRIEQLSLQNLAAWRPDKGAQVSLQATIDGAPLSYTGSITPFGDSLRVDGRIDLRDLPLANFRQITGIAEELAGKLSLDTKISLALSATGINLQLETDTLQLDQLQLVTPQIQLQQQSLRWAGNIELKQTNAASQTAIQVSGTGDIIGEQLNTTLPQQKLDIVQKDLQLDIQFKFESDGSGDEPLISVQLEDLQTHDLHARADTFPLAGMGSLMLENFRLHGARSFEIEKIRIEQGYAAKAVNDKSTPPLFSNDSLTIDTLALKEGHQFSIDNILLNQAKIYLTRAADGGSNLDPLTAAIDQMAGAGAVQEGPADKPPSNEKKATSKPITFHIGHFQVTDDSSVVFDDAGVTPRTRIDVGIENLEFDNIDNSSADEITQLKGKGKIGRFGHYQFSAELRPFAEKVTAKIIASIKGLDLPPLSPYTASDLDFRLQSGTFSSEIDVAIKQDQLAGEVKLTLQQLELIPVEEKDQQGGMTAVSLNTSLNMLRDSNNTIALTIPLSGDINAPDFSINDAINQALISGTKNAARTYFMFALQPYGTMLAVAKFAGEQIAKVRLDPVQFGPGSSEIDETGRDYLKKVAGILGDRPKVAIKVCGIAVDSDTAALAPAPENTEKAENPPAKEPVNEEALRKQLEQLAQQRAIAVREFIISQADKANHQLVSCLPTVESGKVDAVPRVELLI
ncbi:MAG TPA: DUF748 domain-containing protein [Chromatiales bacterium]|nr:DUF748 domain-containing protein [Chromatiales bacterium]HEX22188.1 DUF748 domain-containing protein [Chromatiales bacterium]